MKTKDLDLDRVGFCEVFNGFVQNNRTTLKMCHENGKITSGRRGRTTSFDCNKELDSSLMYGEVSCFGISLMS